MIACFGFIFFFSFSFFFPRTLFLQCSYLAVSSLERLTVNWGLKRSGRAPCLLMQVLKVRLFKSSVRPLVKGGLFSPKEHSTFQGDQQEHRVLSKWKSTFVCIKNGTRSLSVAFVLQYVGLTLCFSMGEPSRLPLIEFITPTVSGG